MIILTIIPMRIITRMITSIATTKRIRTRTTRILRAPIFREASA